MRRFTTIVAVLLLLATAAPVMACITGRAMDQSERTCCTAMHGKCGAMMKMDCCRTVSHAQGPLLAAQAPNLEMHWVALTRIALPLIAMQSDVFARWIAADADSPPGLPPIQTTVLRI